MHIIANKTLANGTTALIAVASAQSGGRRYGQFVTLRVATLPAGKTAADYKSVRSADFVHFAREADARCTGERSRYCQVLKDAEACFLALQ